jgi:hypothetical protein
LYAVEFHPMMGKVGEITKCVGSFGVSNQGISTILEGRCAFGRPKGC